MTHTHTHTTHRQTKHKHTQTHTRLTDGTPSVSHCKVSMINDLRKAYQCTRFFATLRATLWAVSRRTREVWPPICPHAEHPGPISGNNKQLTKQAERQTCHRAAKQFPQHKLGDKLGVLPPISFRNRDLTW